MAQGSRKRKRGNSSAKEDNRPAKKASASQSVMAKFRLDGEELRLSMKIDGRGPSNLGRRQGDHITAYGLVKRGFARVLQDLEFSSDKGLSDLRDRRGKIYEFISEIAALDENLRETLYEEVINILKEYNKHRFEKTKIEKIKNYANREIEGLRKRKGAASEALGYIVEQTEKTKSNNGKLMCDSLESMAEALMTFYNKMPNVSYLQIEGFEPSSAEGAEIKSALEFLENFDKNESKQDQRGSRLRARARSEKEQKEAELPKNIADLFFYPEITDPGALKKHENDTKRFCASSANPRNNSVEDLVTALARHVHIVFAAFPELSSVNKNDLIKKFVSCVIEKSWPSFNEQEQINKISKGVISEVERLKQEAEEHSCQESKGFKDVMSSTVSSKDGSQNGSHQASQASSSPLERGHKRARRESATSVTPDALRQHFMDAASTEDLAQELSARLEGAPCNLKVLKGLENAVKKAVLDKDELLGRVAKLKDDFDRISSATVLRSNSSGRHSSFVKSLLGALSINASSVSITATKTKDDRDFSEIAQTIYDKINKEQRITRETLYTIVTKSLQETKKQPHHASR